MDLNVLSQYDAVGRSYYRIPSTGETSQQQPQLVPLYYEQPSPVNNHASSTTSMASHQAASLAPPTVAKVRDLKSDRIVDAWDKIGVMTSEISSAVMKKQADLVAKRYQIGAASSSSSCDTFSPLVPVEGSSKKKRRRLLEESDSSSSSSSKEAGSPTNLLPVENWSESLTRNVDRMAKMSNLMMEIEYCHRLLRNEMVEIQKDLCP
jgi:hypothetical protein